MTIADPKTFQSSAVKPDDFDQFWEETWLKTKQVPLNPRLEPVPMRSTDEIEVFDAAYDSCFRPLAAIRKRRNLS